MMKRRSFVLLTATVLAVLLTALCLLTASADEPDYTTRIAGHNLALEENVQIVYYVETNAGESVEQGILFWLSPQDEYVYGGEDYKLSENHGTATVDGKEYLRYRFDALSAKMMTDDVYAVSYIKDGESVIYGTLDKYSILQYCYRKKDSASVLDGGTGTLGELVASILDYGAAAQRYLGYKTDRLANATYYEITLVDGTLADKTATGLYQAGDRVSASTTPAEGWTFAHWVNGAGDVIGTATLLENYAVSKTETLTAVSHILGEWIEEVPATFSETGTLAHYHCVDCGKDLDADYIEIADLTIPVLGSRNLAYTSNGDGTCSVSIGTCTDTEIRIPVASESGETVTAISGNGFKDRTSITSVYIPETVTTIGAYAFSGCTGLKSVTIPGSVTSISSYAFRSSGLTSLTLENGVQTIGQYAFLGCSLSSVTIPESVTWIGPSALKCNTLSSVTFANTKGWIAKHDYSTYNLTVTNTSTNATYFKSTYVDFTIYR